MIENLPIAGRERVCCYITRGRELLVFEHEQKYDDGAVGIQVVGGGVDEGETLEQAALRETFEESGLVLENPVFLGTSHYQSKFGRLEGQKQVRHYFWLEAPPETPDSWSYIVSNGELDKGMVFHHRFVALEDVDLIFGMGEMLERLKEAQENVKKLGEDWVFKIKDLFDKGSFGGIVLGDSIATVVSILGQPENFEFIEPSKQISLEYGVLTFIFSGYGLETITMRVLNQNCIIPMNKFDSWFFEKKVELKDAILILEEFNFEFSVEEDIKNRENSIHIHKEFTSIRSNPYHYYLSFYCLDDNHSLYSFFIS